MKKYKPLAEWTKLSKEEIADRLLAGEVLEVNPNVATPTVGHSRDAKYYCKYRQEYAYSKQSPFRLITMQGISEISNIPITETLWNCASYRTYDPEGFLIRDKDLVLCWEVKDLCFRYLRFYDFQYGCTFQYDGSRFGPAFINYEKVDIDALPENIKKWAIKAREKLED